MLQVGVILKSACSHRVFPFGSSLLLYWALFNHGDHGFNRATLKKIPMNTGGVSLFFPKMYLCPRKHNMPSQLNYLDLGATY